MTDKFTIEVVIKKDLQSFNLDPAGPHGALSYSVYVKDLCHKDMVSVKQYSICKVDGQFIVTDLNKGVPVAVRRNIGEVIKYFSTNKTMNVLFDPGVKILRGFVTHYPEGSRFNFDTTEPKTWANRRHKHYADEVMYDRVTYEDNGQQITMTSKEFNFWVDRGYFGDSKQVPTQQVRDLYQQLENIKMQGNPSGYRSAHDTHWDYMGTRMHNPGWNHNSGMPPNYRPGYGDPADPGSVLTDEQKRAIDQAAEEEHQRSKSKIAKLVEHLRKGGTFSNFKP